MSLSSGVVVNDVTTLNPVLMAKVIVPQTIEEIAEAIRNHPGPISVGGGRYSMGGQTAIAGGVQLDMRRFNRVVDFSPDKKLITVQAGIRWRDIQDAIDPSGLSVKAMQTYSNFTVGGALSVNCHGRYVGLGPVILSVKSIKVVLADGRIVLASPEENSEIYYGSIGGYGGLGVIAEATLALADNVKVARERVIMPVSEYKNWFFKNVRNASQAVFHNGDIYPPHYQTVSAVTWSETPNAVTVKDRLIPRGKAYYFERIVMRLVFRLIFGKYYRRFIVDPLVYLKKRIHWRNYEASYDVEELEPPVWARSAHILQEYFVPVDRFDEFVPKMASILQRYDVNALNVSIRHARKDPGSLLAWAREEVFAFVLYYKQRKLTHHRAHVAVWTRELIDAALSVGGAYYLPYQPHATPAQFHAAYPRAREYFALKQRLDPQTKFSNTLWAKYYEAPAKTVDPEPTRVASNFKTVYGHTGLRDGFYRFLQNVYHLYPEDQFHQLIQDAVERCSTDKEVYAELQRLLPGITPLLAGVRYGIPALHKQKVEIARETAELLRGMPSLDGYMEIGTTGRYVDPLQRVLPIKGATYLVNDIAPTNSPADLVERRGLRMPWTFAPIVNYDPIPESVVPAGSVSLATMYIGIHHCPREKMDAFVASIRRILKPGGKFVLRDHNVDSPGMDALVGLAHDVFNCGLGAAWKTNEQEQRYFKSIPWVTEYLASQGFDSAGHTIFQDYDPTRNGLMLFSRR